MLIELLPVRLGHFRTRVLIEKFLLALLTICAIRRALSLGHLCAIASARIELDLPSRLLKARRHLFKFAVRVVQLREWT
jgi:hypothetical protein